MPMILNFKIGNQPRMTCANKINKSKNVIGHPQSENFERKLPNR